MAARQAQEAGVALPGRTVQAEGKRVDRWRHASRRYGVSIARLVAGDANSRVQMNEFHLAVSIGLLEDLL